MQTLMVYMTAPDEKEARKISAHLVENRLAACANLFFGMESIYHWDGAVQQEREVVVIAKTTEALLPRLTEVVLEMHSYECPAVAAVPITGGNPDFLQWIRAQATGLKDK